MLPCVEVSRHAARVIFLEYNGEGPIDSTLILVGKVYLCHNLTCSCDAYSFVCFFGFLPHLTISNTLKIHSVPDLESEI